MNAQQIISLANDQRARSKQGRALDSDLAKTNKAQAERINAMVTEAEQANAKIAELEADRDYWRNQALAVCDAEPQVKAKRGRKPKGA